MKKAIVTGATGFIGKFLVRELVKQNVEVIAVVRRGTKNLNTINALPVKIVECNIADYHMLPDMIADRDIDVVFHIAWQGVSDLDARNEAIQMQNLQSTLDLIDAMHIMRIGCFIGCGSMHEAESLVEMNEDKVISNLGYMYKATKTAAHWIGKAKCGTYGIRFFWPLINTYGEEERSARLVNTIIRKVLHGESPDLSAGNQYYDFVHVSDVARALILIAEKGVDGTNYTIGSGDAKPLKEFLKIVGQVANDLHDGEPVELGFGKITSNVISLPITTFDVTKLYKDTGFKPLIPFRKGIERTARWIKEDKENGGLSSARNAGLDIATGKYVIFIDSDDFWDDASALEHIHINLTETDADVLVFTAKRYYESEDKYTYIITSDVDRTKIIDKDVNASIRYMIENNIYRAAAWNKVVKKSIIDSYSIRKKSIHTH